MKYWVKVTLTTADKVEAKSLEHAFEILSDAAMSSNPWDWYYEEIKDEN